MQNVQITYNPYTVKTEIFINGKKVEKRSSPLIYICNKRLQEWIGPKGSWPGIFDALRTAIGDDQLHLDFIGTSGDLDDIDYAKERFGSCFSNIELVHKNKDQANDIDPYQKMQKLKELYKELQQGPIEEFKSGDIQKNFDAAANSEFRIVIIAPMSSGKSTLINAIIGRDLLPAVNQATTAVITEVKDNDELPYFLVNATDKYGKVAAKDLKATKTVISDLNYRKDPLDPDGKDASIHLIQLEGPIPNLPSNVLNTVFVDTPGGNNSQNDEHEKMMDEAINDENKSLILYVFNGKNLGSDDSDIILQKIAHAMENSANGKQSRDRFMFVANKMDAYDPDTEPYEDVIKNTILPQLRSKNITEPNLFLASALTAKLIRMVNNGDALTEKEEEDMGLLVTRFNRCKTRALPKYASIPSTVKEKLLADAVRYAEEAKETGSAEEAKKLKNLAAEINSGIPAIESAIKEYLEKYAIAIKIKTIHDTFMKKVMERKMIDSCEEEWARSQESFEKIKEELREKREKCDTSKKLQEFRDKIADIKLDIAPIKAAQVKITEKIKRMSENAEEKVRREEAGYILSLFKHNLSDIGQDALASLEHALNSGVQRSCQDILEEYAGYIQELDADGLFTIGSFDIKQTDGFAAFEMGKVDDILQEDKYIRNEDVKVGTTTVPKKGFFAAIERLFGGGYETLDCYEEQQFILLKQLITDQVTRIQHSFDKEINFAITDTQQKVEQLKEQTNRKLEGIDRLVSDLIAEIDHMLVSQEELQKKVRENADKTKWLKGFVQKVEDLLTV